MKKILFILKEFPYPIAKSGLTLIDNRLLKSLDGKYIVDLYINNESTLNNSLEIKNEFPCIDKVYMCSDLVNQNHFNILKNIFKIMLRLNNSKSEINKIISNENYSMIYFCVPPSPLFFFLYKINIPIFLNAVDSFSLLNFRFYHSKKKIIDYIKYRLYLILEEKCYKIPAIVNFVSSVDTEFLRKKTNLKNLLCIRNGVDINYFSEKIYIRQNKTLLFVGNFLYRPNVEAINYFINDIFPPLLKKFPDIKLYIVGPNSSFKFDSKSIIVTGFVEDIREYYQKASVFISPLLSGSGVKNKVLEALSSGTPVVSTSIGVDGIDKVVDGIHFLKGDTSSDFLSNIIAILNDDNLAHNLSVQSKKLMNEEFDWSNCLRSYISQFEKIAI